MSPAASMPAAIQRIGDLPFCEQPVLELLGLTHAGDAVDLDYTGYGWARVDGLWLSGSGALRSVDDALVLALHAADDADPLSDDVELEFVLAPAATEHSVTALASAFLERWLPRLPRASAIVLAMCNPHRAQLRTPRAANVPLFYGVGDVDSWLDTTDSGPRLRLAADDWRLSCPEVSQ